VARAPRPSPQRATRRDAQVARTREEIVLAAARCLARGGIGAVSMQQIAAEVGFTAPALYMYFESREAIFEELFLGVRRELQELFAGPAPAARERGAAAFSRRLAAMIRRQLEWMDRRRDVLQGAMALRLRADPWRPRTTAKGPDAQGEPMPLLHQRLMTEWLSAEAKHADVKTFLGGYDAGEAASFLLGTMQGFIWRWLRSPIPGQRVADETDHILALFFHGVLGARAALNRS
jgi:AcrR family transcriptional regulator